MVGGAVILTGIPASLRRVGHNASGAATMTLGRTVGAAMKSCVAQLAGEGPPWGKIRLAVMNNLTKLKDKRRSIDSQGTRANRFLGGLCRHVRTLI
jgi:hypothetical protein